MYSVPHISSLNSEIYEFKQPKVIDFEIYVDYNEMNAKQFEIYLFECLKKYEKTFSRYGYIINIRKILEYSDMIIMPFYFENKMKIIVKAECNVFDISENSMLLNCKMINLTKNKALFKYKNSIFVFVSNIKNLEEAEFKKRHNILITKILNKHIFTDTFIFYVKKNNKLRKINVKDILTDVFISKYKSVETLDVILSDGSKETIKTSKIDKIHTNYQAIFDGQINDIWNIPMRLRFMKYSNNSTTRLNNSTNRLNNSITSFNIKSTKEHIDLERKFYPEKKYEKYSELSSTLHFLGQNSKGTVPDNRLLWNRFMKYYINPYEMLKPAVTYRSFKYNEKIVLKKYNIPEYPVSRAYYKMFEILHVFKLIDPKNSNLLSLGDAPGGFAQCFNHIFPKAKIKTISLNNSKKTKDKLGLNDVDIIKYHKIIKSNKNIFIEYMKDKTGDILDLDNIRYMAKKYQNKMDIIAGDAALSYYELYLLGVSKESQHTRLFLCEIIISLMCLKLGGSFCVKLYGRYTEVTAQIIQWLAEMFESVYLYKLKSIRITNNETFLICTKYKTLFKDLEKILAELKKTPFDSFITSIADINLNDYLIKNIKLYNIGLDKIKIFTHELGYELYIEENNFDYMRKKSVHKKQWDYVLNHFINNSVD